MNPVQKYFQKKCEQESYEYTVMIYIHRLLILNV